MSDERKTNGNGNGQSPLPGSTGSPLETENALSELRALAEGHEFELRSSESEPSLGTDASLERRAIVVHLS